MSFNRRRWSNELLDSLMDFQNKTSSELNDSMNKDKEQVSPADLLNDRCRCLDTESLETSSYRQVGDFNFLKNDEKTDCDKKNVYSYLNNKVVENISVSSEETANFFSCDSSNNQNTIDTQSIKSQSTQYSCEIFHEAITFHHENIMKNNENPGSQSNESSQIDNIILKDEVTTVKNHSSTNLMLFDNEGDMTKRFFSSPVEFPNLCKEQIGEVTQPDIWDALQELDQILSPFGEEETIAKEKQPTPNLLSRLSRKFKKTPSRFTEKLISILEDSVISTESPTKHNVANNSGISLHRMTGEFRKLCKFIEDESMPELVPSMANTTALYTEKTETSESDKALENHTLETPRNTIRYIQDTPTHKSTPQALRALLTPKSKVISRNQTPIKQFTPSADKSFEYWEKICNIMCDPNSAEKIKRKTPLIQEGAKRSMDEMLTICERQMASLDNTTIDIRTSEPCKKTDSEIKLKILQTPRSKSVSKTYESCGKNVKSLYKKNEVDKTDGKLDEKIIIQVAGKEENVEKEKPINLDDTIDDTVIMTDSDNTSSDSSFLKRRMLKLNDQDSFKIDSKDTSVNEQNSYDGHEPLKKEKSEEQKLFENDFKLISYSPQDTQSKTQSELSYDPDDPDCSLIAELALRRQRCLETAKLMMEIDQEDPMTSDQDKTCLETLYKLGIQDKTFAEVEEDTKFLNTLNECLEYRNYFSEKKKPIIKALQKFDTPEEMKKKTTSIIRSQSQMITKKPAVKSTLQRANSNKTLYNSKMTPRLASSIAASKVTPRITKTSSNLRAMPRTSATTPSSSAIAPRVSATTSKVPSIIQRTTSTTTPRIMNTTPRPMPRSTSKITPQVTKRTLYPQTEQSKLAHKLPIKTPQSLQKPILRRPIFRLSANTTQKLTPPSELKPCASKVVEKSTPSSELKSDTARLAEKLLSPPPTEIITSKPTPKRVADLKSPTKVTTSPPITPRPRFFLSPGKSPNNVILGRKKPASYFSEKAPKIPLTPHNFNRDIKSPIGLYINSIDNDLIKNIHAKTNDRLLTPVSYGENGKSPRLKIRLASKENQSPPVCNENIVLPTVRYQSAKNIFLIDNKSSYSPSSITPNSKTKKLLESVENTIIIRHEGRICEPNQKTNYDDVETSIRVRKVAEKTTPLRRKVME
ncbi:uncharacterized protein LOC131673424 [Phymastichus coffea]|uniref:uncharacterized protein LOC131673424 n=1 Tax=Phymastichus coffea TaxID=108790 RepID=UPI00273C9580|nr:uncharacterized protein LOC131673424 [Phymastichus coffea]